MVVNNPLNKFLHLVASILCLGFLVISALSFFEIYKAKVSPEDYHFGSESMIAAGGAKYQSLEGYVAYNFSVAVGTLLVNAIFLFFILKKNRAAHVR